MPMVSKTIKKVEVFWFFQGVQKEINDMEWVDHRFNPYNDAIVFKSAFDEI